MTAMMNLSLNDEPITRPNCSNLSEGFRSDLVNRLAGGFRSVGSRKCATTLRHTFQHVTESGDHQLTLSIPIGLRIWRQIAELSRKIMLLNAVEEMANGCDLWCVHLLFLRASDRHGIQRSYGQQNYADAPDNTSSLLRHIICPIRISVTASKHLKRGQVNVSEPLKASAGLASELSSRRLTRSRRLSVLNYVALPALARVAERIRS